MEHSRTGPKTISAGYPTGLLSKQHALVDCLRTELGRERLATRPSLDELFSGVHDKARISKSGNREVRKRLYEATLSATRHNPNILAIYRRLKDRGKPDRVARIAAARKLLLLAYAIYESSETSRLPVEEATWHSIQYLTPSPD